MIFAGPEERIELTHRAEDRTHVRARRGQGGAVGARQEAGALFDGRRARALKRLLDRMRKSAMSDRLLVLVRHGQSEWNLKNLFTGWKDLDLTEQGIAEAQARRPQAEGAGARRSTSPSPRRSSARSTRST